MRVGAHGGGVPAYEPEPEEVATPAAPLADPTLPRGKDFNGRPFPAMHYAAVSGRPFVNGASPGDVGQGNLGDCFFLSSLAAVAKTDPEVLERAIRRNRDGTYTVTFKAAGRDGKMRDHPITVDATFPHDPRGAQTFGRSLEKGELWPAIFEKAFARWKGGYTRLDDGGYGEKALTALTGKPSHYRTLSAVSEERLWETLQAAKRGGHPVVSGTPDARTLKRLTGRADMGGLIDGHEYAVLDAFERRGERLVRLYTPLLPGDAGGPKGAGREITLPLKDYKRLFADLVTSEA